MSARAHEGVTWPVEIWIPGAPVAKARARHGKTRDGRPVTYSDPKTKSWELQVGMLASVAMGDSEPSQAPIALTLDVGLAPPRSWSQRRRDAATAGEIAATKRPDLDNFVKSVLDGLDGVVFADDSQVVRLEVHKRYSARPGVSITVREVQARRAP